MADNKRPTKLQFSLKLKPGSFSSLFIIFNLPYFFNLKRYPQKGRPDEKRPTKRSTKKVDKKVDKKFDKKVDKKDRQKRSTRFLRSNLQTNLSHFLCTSISNFSVFNKGQLKKADKKGRQDV